MRYYKYSDAGYVLAIGTGNGGTEITQTEYQTLSETISARPADAAGCGYKLREDLSWEPYTLPVTQAPTVYSADTLGAMSNAELEAILASYGLTASMNKANMVALILAAQEQQPA